MKEKSSNHSAVSKSDRSSSELTEVKMSRIDRIRRLEAIAAGKEVEPLTVVRLNCPEPVEVEEVEETTPDKEDIAEFVPFQEPTPKKQRISVPIPEVDWDPSKEVIQKYRALGRRSREKGDAITITLEQVRDVLEGSVLCAYCEHDTATGFDRVNSKIGYTVENCVPACRECNVMKFTMTLEEFIERVSRINSVFESKRANTRKS